MPDEYTDVISLRNSIPESLRILKLSRTTLYERADRGLIKITKDGGRSFISGSEIRRYLAACEEVSS